MTRLELELDGVTVTARLLDEDAPRTCRALWDALPFEALVVHSRWAGARLHTRTHPKIDVGPISYPFIENPSAYQAPGDVVVWPLNNELMISYGPGKFEWMDQHYLVTHVATIEGNFSEFAGKIERLQWEGAKKLVIRRSARESSPGPVAATGTRFKIECEGRTWIGELFEERAPRICKAFLEALPLEGPITNTHGQR